MDFSLRWSEKAPSAIDLILLFLKFSLWRFALDGKTSFGTDLMSLSCKNTSCTNHGIAFGTVSSCTELQVAVLSCSSQTHSTGQDSMWSKNKRRRYRVRLHDLWKFGMWILFTELTSKKQSAFLKNWGKFTRVIENELVTSWCTSSMV